MSLTRGGRPRHRGGFPRVSGDEPFSFSSGYGQTVFSPRERGGAPVNLPVDEAGLVFPA